VTISFSAECTDLERRCPMRTGELDRKERMEVLLEDKNAMSYGAGGSFDGIVPS
jgi:hypothetical protein